MKMFTEGSLADGLTVRQALTNRAKEVWFLPEHSPKQHCSQNACHFLDNIPSRFLMEEPKCFTCTLELCLLISQLKHSLLCPFDQNF